MSSPPAVLRGIVPILVTPFDERGAIDEPSLRNEVDFAIDVGVHGLGIALGSEVFKLTEAERDQVLTIVIDQTRRRVPVVMNTGAAATDLAVSFSKRAQALGAAGVMCTPPGPGFASDAVISYFKAISDSVSVPVIVQDTATTPVSAPLIKAIAEACVNVTYAKVESVPPAAQVSKAVQIAGGRVRVFGGAGGGQFLRELRRGAIGTMPFPSTARAFVDAWDAWQRGDKTAAHQVFDERIMPLLKLDVGSLGGALIVHKMALQRQGVISSAVVRPPVEPLDPIALDELEEAFVQLGWAEGGSTTIGDQRT